MVEHNVVSARFPRTESAQLNTVAPRAHATTRADSEMANDDVVNAIVIARYDAFNRNPGSRCCLPSNCNERLCNSDVSPNGTAHREHRNIPVALIGTFAVFPLLGFSVNTLSLLGLMAAIFAEKSCNT